MGVNPYDLGLSKALLDMIPKAQMTKDRQTKTQENNKKQTNHKVPALKLNLCVSEDSSVM